MTANIRARKSLGQHWLVDQRVLARISRSADFSSRDTVVEVGPGRGALTRLLAPRAGKLILVEVDRDLAARLRDEYGESATVNVVEGDVTEVPVVDLLNRGHGGIPYVVVGNLPYFVGSAIVRKFLTDPVRPRWLVVTLQAEVARRMAAPPGEMSYLSVEVQTYAEARVLFTIPPTAFRPKPKVSSAVLRLEVRDSPAVEVDDLERFLGLVRAGFATPRKLLRNSLAHGLRIGAPEADAIVAGAGLDAGHRPQDLGLDDWRALYFAHRRLTG